MQPCSPHLRLLYVGNWLLGASPRAWCRFNGVGAFLAIQLCFDKNMSSPDLDYILKSAQFVTETPAVEAKEPSVIDGFVKAILAVEPPVVQRCIGPYGNAFYGVRPVFQLVEHLGRKPTFVLCPDWELAVLENDATKLPPIARRSNLNLPLCHLAAYEREPRFQIVAEEERERSRVYPMVIHEEYTARAAIEDSYNWELSELAWEFVYGNNEWWHSQFKHLFRVKRIHQQDELTVKSVIGTNVELETGNPWVEVFESLPGANTLYWVALQVSRFGTIYQGRPPPSMRFFQAGKILDRSGYQVKCWTNSTVHFPDIACSSLFGYLINIETWPKLLSSHTVPPQPWEALWDEPTSMETFKLTTSANFNLFDPDELHSNRDIKRFLRSISPLTPEEFHWRARCLSPGAGCVWCPETDKYWPMLFRKMVRYCLQIRVAAGVSGVGHLPHEVVCIVGSFL